MVHTLFCAFYTGSNLTTNPFFLTLDRTNVRKLAASKEAACDILMSEFTRRLRRVHGQPGERIRGREQTRAVEA